MLFLVTADELGAEIVAHALRAVGHADFGNPEPRYGADEEGIVTSDIVDLLFERHSPDQLTGTCLVFRGDGCARKAVTAVSAAAISRKVLCISS